MTDKLLTSTEACERLGISRSTLTQWLGKTWITAAHQLGSGAYVFTGAEVDRAGLAHPVRERAASREQQADESARVQRARAAS